MIKEQKCVNFCNQVSFPPLGHSKETLVELRNNEKMEQDQHLACDRKNELTLRAFNFGPDRGVKKRKNHQLLK